MDISGTKTSSVDPVFLNVEISVGTTESEFTKNFVLYSLGSTMTLNVYCMIGLSLNSRLWYRTSKNIFGQILILEHKINRR